jgi:undecaprenyl-diphosphatase
MRNRQLALVAGVAAVALVALTTAVTLGVPVLTRVDHATGAAALRVTRAHPSLRSFWSADASVQGPTVCRLVMLGGVLWLLRARRWWYAGWLALVLVISTALSGVVKQPLARARPTWHHPVASAPGYSYPSGHATAGWVLAASAVLLALALLQVSARRRLLVALAVASAVLVSLDRVFLGLHYLSDVVAGALVGCLLTLLPWLLLTALTRRSVCTPAPAGRAQRHDALRGRPAP